MQKPNAEAFRWPAGLALAGIGSAVLSLRAGWIGYVMYFQQPGINTDTFAPAFLALPWALGGALLGGGAALLIAAALFVPKWSGKRHPLISGGLTLIVLLVATAYLPEIAEKAANSRRPPATTETPQTKAKPATNPCHGTPPGDAGLRRAWEAECR